MILTDSEEKEYRAFKKRLERVIDKIYRDTRTKKAKQGFIVLEYKVEIFKGLIDPDHLFEVVDLLIDTTYNNRPFIIAVEKDKKTKSFKLVVSNLKE